MGAGERLGRARGAADRRVARGDQGVHQHAVLGDVALHVVVAPGRERVELHEPELLVVGDQRRVRPGGGLDAAHSGDPGVVARQRVGERLDLAHRAAEVGIAGEEVLAELDVLRRHRAAGPRVDDLDVVDVLDGVARADGLGEVVAGLQEEDLDARQRAGGQVDQHRVLHVGGHDHPHAERLGRPREHLFGGGVRPQLGGPALGEGS